MNGNSAPHLQRAPTAPAKMSGSFPFNQPHSYQQNNVLQQNGIYHLDPAQAPFQQYGTGLQRYETPRSLNVPVHHDQLVDLVARHSIQQLTETSRLDHETRSLTREINNLHDVFKKDVTSLEKRISSLQLAQVPETSQKQIKAANPAEIEYTYYHTAPDGNPSDEMLAAHPKEQIANSYLDEAEKREASASLLRQQAFEICPDILEEQKSAGRLQIESAPLAAHPVVASGYACCKTEFSAIAELVEHVERTHTAPEHRLLAQERSKAAEVQVQKQPAPPAPTDEKPLQLTEEKQKTEDGVKSFKQETSPWTPTAVRNMPSALADIPDKTETFSFDFLRAMFAGDEWSPGFYFIPKKSILPSKSYWILTPTHEPFLPISPGQHGAKLTVFFNETASDAGKAPGEENYLKVPVFIKTSGKDEYSYFGDYSQLRFSDKLGYDTITDKVPESVLRAHALELAENGRPEWVTKALKEHFWPKPKYEGPMPTDSALNSPTTSIHDGNSAINGQERRVLKALVDYSAVLKDWEKDSKLKVALLTAKSIFESFSSADADSEPGLRLFWEYLQCVNWDMGFYNMLVGLKKTGVTKLEIGSAGKQRRPSPVRNDGSTAVKKGQPPEDTFRSTKGKAKAKERMELHPGPDARTEFVKVNFDEKPVDTKKGGLSNGSGKKEAVKTSSSKTNGAPPLGGPKGDLAAAKAFNDQVTKAGGKPTFVPPHMRGRKPER